MKRRAKEKRDVTRALHHFERVPTAHALGREILDPPLRRWGTTDDAGWVCESGFHRFHGSVREARLCAEWARGR